MIIIMLVTSSYFYSIVFCLNSGVKLQKLSHSVRSCLKKDKKRIVITPLHRLSQVDAILLPY